MEPIKNHFRLVGKIFMLIGTPFLAASIIFIILRLAAVSENPSVLYVFSVLAMVFGSQGIIWLPMGACFYIYDKRKEMRNEFYKREGIKFEAEIVRIIPRPYVRINGYISVYAECSYINQDGKKCLVKSSPFMYYNVNEKLNANVYVNPYNPMDYYVEINEKTETDGQFDYDYR